MPLDQYVEMVRQQRPREGWLTKEALAKAFKGMVLTERILSQIGPGRQFRQFAAALRQARRRQDVPDRIARTTSTPRPIFLPYAIECQGNIVQLYDPIYHQRVDEDDEPSVLAVSVERSYDRRWVKCKRPFIVSGGELTHGHARPALQRRPPRSTRRRSSSRPTTAST